MRRVIKRLQTSMFSEAEILRKGDTEKKWYHETDIVECRVEKSAIDLYFETRSAGPGMSNLRVLVRPVDFPKLIALMTQADQDAAIKAMVEELRYQICEKSEDPLSRKRSAN